MDHNNTNQEMHEFAPQKIEMAIELLWQTDLSVDNIAERVGLEGVELRKLFQTLYSVSPEEFRKNHRRTLRNKIPVVFVTNDGYVPYLSTAIYSLAENRDKNREYAAFVFHSGLSLKSIALLRRLRETGVDIEFVDLEEQLESYKEFFYTCAHYTKETYYRLFIPTFMGKLYDKIIYLDADLVVNCDISEILEAGNSEKTINAALNYSTESDALYIKSLGLTPQSYVNAGVMTIDCKRYVRAKYFEKAVERLKRREELRYVDQDILNLICAGDIGVIEPSWNVQWNFIRQPKKYSSDIRDLITKIDPPHIVHFTFEKPWHVMLNEYGDYYWKYVSKFKKTYSDSTGQDNI